MNTPDNLNQPQSNSRRTLGFSLIVLAAVALFLFYVHQLTVEFIMLLLELFLTA